jgi:hypothetical protein
MAMHEFIQVMSIDPVLAYVGPGAGLTMLGALAAVASVLAFAVLGPLVYGVHVLKAFVRQRNEKLRHGTGKN